MALDPYGVLGVAPSATDAEVRDAYLRRSKQVHPDRLVDATPTERDAATRAMQDLAVAYETLRARGAVGDPAPAAATATPAYTAPPRRRRRRRWIVLVVAMIASTVLALVVTDPSPPPPDLQRGDDLSVLDGKCITLTVTGQFEDVVDCTRPHDARVVKVVPHPTVCPVWSDSRIVGPTQDLCLDTA